ncbi:hypothetical protein SAMN06295924_104143 [Rathayibacter rathayi NCPPB 2980 = VKM Ac-1601]|nr:hypothetical protein FB469_2382 [Rathayibacter rathayi]SOE04469.1 hypothetical protein SAMN06295924_104143 [Rathayibacter rathayi NCPPB 2980 = VKM Ac-1601]
MAGRTTLRTTILQGAVHVGDQVGGQGLDRAAIEPGEGDRPRVPDHVGGRQGGARRRLVADTPVRIGQPQLARSGTGVVGRLKHSAAVGDLAPAGVERETVIRETRGRDVPEVHVLGNEVVSRSDAYCAGTGGSVGGCRDLVVRRCGGLGVTSVLCSGSSPRGRGWRPRRRPGRAVNRTDVIALTRRAAWWKTRRPAAERLGSRRSSNGSRHRVRRRLGPGPRRRRSGSARFPSA